MKIQTLAFLLLSAAAAPCLAQQAQHAALAVDTVVGFDEAVDQYGNAMPGVVVDSVVSAALGSGFEAIVRPWAQRLGSTREWNRQIWLASIRYDRRGPVGLRIEGGLIPSPVGYANLFLRPQLNPTISMPASLFQPLPAVERGAPRTTMLGGIYPFGASATLSTPRWDVRAAAIDTSPLRMRRVFANANPPRFLNAVIGGGVSPVVGLRVGGSVTHGGWRRASEVAAAPAVASARDLNATVLTVESEYAFRHTKLGGEWVRTVIETGSGRDVAVSGWFVQGQQTLTPRWFAAGRIERIASPALTSADTFETRRLDGVEETLGYRLTPELTVRAGHRARRAFGRDAFAHTAAVSVVWWKRWM